ncbi:MAG: SOS response-associated peptidase [Rhizobiales bacterium]|nr:SOS response-associated peptidase [Hyphomicrobiales bacterium]
MCNLYSTKQSVDEVRSWFKVTRVNPSAGNLPAQPSIFPAHDAPVVRLADDGERELTVMKWGFVLPQQGKAPKHVNNCRDDKATTSNFWKASFRERRCLVPASSFAEYHPTERDEKGRKAIAWFALKGDEPRPPFAFAGLWRSFRGNYKGELTEFDTHTIMTTSPNEVVKPIHSTRMPVILDPSDYETWLAGSPDDAIKLTKPFSADRMQVAVIGGNQDDWRA